MKMSSWVKSLFSKVSGCIASSTVSKRRKTEHQIKVSLKPHSSRCYIPIPTDEIPPIPERSPLRPRPYISEVQLENESASLKASTSSGISAYYSFISHKSYKQSQSMQELQVIASAYYNFTLPLCLHFLGILDPPAYRPYCFKELKKKLEVGILRETDNIKHDGSLEFEEEWHNLRTNAFRTLYDISMEYMKREDERLRRQMKHSSSMGPLMAKIAAYLLFWNGSSALSLTDAVSRVGSQKDLNGKSMPGTDTLGKRSTSRYSTHQFPVSA